MSLKNPKQAVLVVDVQEGLFRTPSAPLHQPAEMLARISEILSRARNLDVPILYTRFVGPPGSPLEDGASGSEIHAAVSPQAGDVVLLKDDSDAFLRTDLRQRLESLGVSTLVVCGLQSEFCVDSTCRTAYGHGLEVVLVEDGHTTSDSTALSGEQIVDHHNRTLGRAYVTVRPAAEVFS